MKSIKNTSYTILFVCTGNIYRSPTADGILRQLCKSQSDLSDWSCDSAGLYGYHIGDPPDSRSQKVALDHGVDISGLRARKFTEADFENFDIIYAMDQGHFSHLQTLARSESEKQKLSLFIDGFDVPDPYYSSDQAFENVFHLIHDRIIQIVEEKTGNKYDG